MTPTNFRSKYNPFRAFARPQRQAIHQSENQGGPKNSEMKKVLSKALKQNGLINADGPKSIRSVFKKAREQLERMKQPPESELFKELEGLEKELIQKTQKIHIESMLLKLIKAAAMETNSTSEALAHVKKSPGIKHQPKALLELEEISKELKDVKNLQDMNVASQLRLRPRLQSEPSSDLIDTSRIVKKAIKHAPISDRIDKLDTGLKYTIIVSEDKSLIVLKNSIEYDDDSEDHSLRRNLGITANENYNAENNTVISYSRTHTHPKKNAHLKVVYGKGGCGKVRLAEDMLTGEKFAVKKMRGITHANTEINETKKLIRALKISGNSDDIRFFLTPEKIAHTVGADGKDKAYVTSKLENNDGVVSLKKLNDVKLGSGQQAFELAHGKFILQIMDTLQALNRNNIVHGDLKWSNIVGGKSADLSGLCYKYGDPIPMATMEYLPPEIEQKNKFFKHPSLESYNTHVSFTFGRMLLESIDQRAHDKFPLMESSFVPNQPAHGYSSDTLIPTHDSSGHPFSDYEKEIIHLAYSLADTTPENRLTIEEARERMSGSYRRSFPNMGS